MLRIIKNIMKGLSWSGMGLFKDNIGKVGSRKQGFSRMILLCLIVVRIKGLIVLLWIALGLRRIFLIMT